MSNPSDQTSGQNRSSPFATVNCAQTRIHLLERVHHPSSLCLLYLCVVLFEQPPYHGLPRSRHGLTSLKKPHYAWSKFFLTLPNAPHILHIKHLMYCSKPQLIIVRHISSPKYMINHVQLCVQIHPPTPHQTPHVFNILVIYMEKRNWELIGCYNRGLHLFLQRCVKVNWVYSNTCKRWLLTYMWEEWKILWLIKEKLW